MRGIERASVLQAMHKGMPAPGEHQRRVRSAFRLLFRLARRLEDPVCADFVRWQTREQFRRNARVVSRPKQREFLFGSRASARMVQDAVDGDRGALGHLMDNAYARVGPLQLVLQERVQEVLLRGSRPPIVVPKRKQRRREAALPVALERVVQLAVLDAKVRAAADSAQCRRSSPPPRAQRIQAATSYAVPPGGLPDPAADAPGVPHDRTHYATVDPAHLPGASPGVQAALRRADARSAAMADGSRRAPAEQPPVPEGWAGHFAQGPPDYSRAPLTRSEREFAHWYTEPLHPGHRGQSMHAPLAPGVQRMLLDYLRDTDAASRCVARRGVAWRCVALTPPR